MMRRGQNSFLPTRIAICCGLNYSVHTLNLIKGSSLVSDPLTNIINIVLEILKDVFVFYSQNAFQTLQQLHKFAVGIKSAQICSGNIVCVAAEVPRK